MDALKRLTYMDDRPFGSIPNAKYYFPSDGLEAARQAVTRAVRRCEGPAMIVGGAGLGKSMLLQVVAQDVADRFDVVPILGGNINNRLALLQNVLYELQLPYRNLSEGELRLAILDRLMPGGDGAPDGVCILVDEAQVLPPELLEELRLMTNFTRNGTARVRLVLAGCPVLEEVLAAPALELLHQRLAVRSYLSPLTRSETAEYVRHQFTVAGIDPVTVITDDALRAVHTGSEGIPRLINQIMDHAIVLAADRDQCPISATLIDEAWADLQQLPTPWTEIGAERNPTSHEDAPAIEFGALDEEEETSCAVEFNATSTRAVTDSDWGDEAREGEPSEKPFADPTPLEAGVVSEGSDREGRHASHSELEPAEPTGQDLVEQVDEPGDAGTGTHDSPTTEGAEPPICTSKTDPESDHAIEMVENQFGFFAAFAPQSWDDAHLESTASEPLVPEVQPDESAQRMTALEEELRQIESLGFWEQDPPIHTGSGCVPSAQGNMARDLFGSDFAEELEIPPVAPAVGQDASGEPCQELPHARGDEVEQRGDLRHDITGETGTEPQAETDGLEPGPESPAAAGTTAPAAVAEPAGGGTDDVSLDIPEYQLFALSANEQVITQTYDLNDLRWNSDPVADDARLEQAAACGQAEAASPACNLSADEVQTTAIPIVQALGSIQPFEFTAFPSDLSQELHLQGEIEKLVSQLNFSAFAVETELAEEVRLSPVGADPRGPQEVAEAGPQYPSQSAPADQLFAPGALSQNDDRDLLVIESDIAVCDSITNPPSDRPAVRTPPYAQLFSRLRNG